MNKYFYLRFNPSNTMHIRREVESIGFNKHKVEIPNNTALTINPTRAKTDAFVQGLIKGIAGFVVGAGIVFMASALTGGLGIGAIALGGITLALIAVISDIAFRVLEMRKGKVEINPKNMMDAIRKHWQEKAKKNEMIDGFQHDMNRDTYHLKKEIISKPLNADAIAEEKNARNLALNLNNIKIRKIFGHDALKNIYCIAQQAFSVDSCEFLTNEALILEDEAKIKNPNICVFLKHIKNEYFLNETKDNIAEVYIVSHYKHQYIDIKNGNEEFKNYRSSITKISLKMNELNQDYSFIPDNDIQEIAPSLKVVMMYSENCKTQDEAYGQVLSLNKSY